MTDRPRRAAVSRAYVDATPFKGETTVTLAYLDPGSGSLIASALVGGVAAAGVAAKQARARLGGFGRKKKSAPETPAEPTDAPVTAASADAPADATTADETTAVTSDT